MPDIDERVVQMRFDNKQFEKGVSESLKTLDKLKDKLKLEEASKSLINLDKIVSNLNLDSLENGVNRISNAFTPLGKIAQKTLDSIANKAVSTGKQLAGMLTGFNDMLAGKAKYELETKSVQTITNATGKSVREVEDVLSKLMHYTDETSYDFAQMASSIGKFTSVGIELETAEEAMEGIANWAAKSGADKQMANRAMYNISQAMGAGSMMIRDWMSIENANMATKEFKETAIDTAKALGKLADAGEGAGLISAGKKKSKKVDYQTFRETLKYGWLDAEVLTETLRKYGDQTTQFGLDAYHAAQNALTFTDAIEAVKDSVSSGWMQTLQHIFGNLDEARVFWTDLATWMQEFAGIFSESRNRILEGWHDFGGYQDLIESITNVWRTFENVVLGIREAIQQVFPPETSEHLVELTKKVKEGTRAFRDMFAINRWDEVEETFEETVDYAEQLTKTLKIGDKGEEVEQLMSALKKAGYGINLSEESDDWGIYNKNVKRVIEKLQKDLHVNVTGEWDEATRKAAITKGTFVETIEVTKEVVAQTDFVSKGMAHILEIVNGICGALKIVVNILKGGWDIAVGFISIFSPVIDLLGRFGAMFGMMFKNLSDDIQNGGYISQFVDSITMAFEPLANIIEIVTGYLHDFINEYAYALRATNRRNTFGNFFAFLINYLKENTILGPVIAIGEAILGTIFTIADTIVRTVKSVVWTIVDTVGSLFGLFDGQESEQSGLIIFLSTISSFAVMAGQALSTVVSIIGEVFTRLVKSLSGIAGPAISTASGVIMNLIYLLLNNLPTILPMLLQLAPIILAIIAAIATVTKTKGPIAGAKASLLGIVGAFAFFIVASNKDKIIKFFVDVINYIKQLKLTNKITEVIKNLIDKFKELFSINPDLSFFENVRNIITRIANDIIKKIRDVWHSFTTIFVPDESELGTTIIDRLWNRIQPFVEWLEAIAQPIGDAWRKIFNIDDLDDQTSFLESMLNGIKSAFSSVVNFAGSILDSGYIDTIISGLFAYGIYKIGAGINKFSRNIGLVINAFGKDLTVKKDTLGTTALKFAGAVAMISASIALLSQISFENTKGVINGLNAYLEVIGVTAGIIVAMQAVDRYLNMGRGKFVFIKEVLGLTAAIALLSAGLLGIQHFLAGGQVLGSLLLVGGIIVGLAAIDALLSVFRAGRGNVNGVTDLCLGVLAVVGAIQLMAIGINILGKENVEASLDMLKSIIIILGVIAVAMSAITARFSLGKNGENSASVKGIVGLCAGVYIVVLAIARLTRLFNSAGIDPAKQSNIIKASIGVGIILAVLGATAVAIAAFSRSTDSKKSHIGSAVVMIGALIVGVNLIATAITKLMKTISSTITQNGNDDAFWGAETILITILAGIGVLFGVVSSISKDIEFKKAATTLVPLIPLFGGLILVIYTLMDGLSKIKDIDTGTAVSTMVGLAAIVAVAGGLFAYLTTTKIDIKTMMSASVGIAAFFVGLGVGIGALLAIGAIGIQNAAQALWILGNDLKSFSESISYVDWDNIKNVKLFFTDTLSEIVSGIIGQNYDDAITGMIKLVSIGSYFSNYSRSMSRLPENPGNINRRAIQLISGARTIADNLNEIKFKKTSTNSNIVAIGSELSLYSRSINRVVTDGIPKAIDVANNAKKVSGIINSISISNEINTTLTEFGSAIQLYYSAIAHAGLDENGNPINTDGISIDTNLLREVMSGLANSISPEILEEISSYAEGREHDATGLALGITALANAFEIYGAKIGGLNPEEVKTANSVLETVSGVYEKLSNSNIENDIGYINNLQSDNKLSLFATGIEALAGALGIYKDEIGGIKPDEVKAANTVLNNVTELDKYLNSANSSTYVNIDGMSSSLPDETLITKFSGQLTTLGNGIADYCSSTKDVTPTQITNANRVLSFVAGIQNILPETGASLWTFLAGDQSLDNLGHGLQQIGDGLSKYKEALGDTEITDSDLKIFDGIRSLAYGAAALGRSGGAIDLLAGSFTWESLSAGLPELATKMVEFQGAAKDFNISSLSETFAAMDKLSAFLESAEKVYRYEGGDRGYSNLLESVAQGVTGMFSELSKLPDATIPDGWGTKNVLAQLKQLGTNFIIAIAAGIDASDTDDFSIITNSLSNVIQNGIKNTMAYYAGFKSLGVYLCEGMAEGITEGLEPIMKAIKTMDESLIGQVMEDTEVHSPSRKFEWIAQMCAIGMANGFTKYAYLINDAVDVMATDSIDTIVSAFKETQFKNVGFGALGAVRELLLKGGKDRKFTDRDLKVVKDLLVQSKYLSEENVGNVDAVKESIKAFKEEVLGIENATGDTWGYSDSLKLWQQINNSLYNDGKYGYTQLQYEVDAMRQLGDETALATDKMTEANERLLDSVESLSDMYNVLSEDQKKIVEESIDPDWMTEALYWSNVGDELVKKFGETTNDPYDIPYTGRSGINNDSELNRMFKLNSGFAGGTNLLEELTNWGSINGDFSGGIEDLIKDTIGSLTGEGGLFGEGGMFSPSAIKENFVGLFTDENGVFASIGNWLNGEGGLFGEGGMLSSLKDTIVTQFTGENGIFATIGNSLTGEGGLLSSAFGEDGYIRNFFRDLFGTDGEIAAIAQENPIDMPVRPVIDMSTIGEDGLTLDGNYVYNIEAKNLTADFSTEAAQTIASASSSQVNELLNLKQALIDSGYASKGVLDKIDGRLTALGTDVKNMKIYLDGNKLVGYVTPKIDSSLYNRYAQMGRFAK